MGDRALIEVLVSGEYRATLLGWPEITAQGATEQEAVGRLREMVRGRLAQGKIISIDLGVDSKPNPWLEISKRFRDNELLDEVEEAIRQERGEPSERG